MIKITGGDLKGRYITSIEGDTTRPTSSKVREAIFNILSYRIEDSVFLDLFAGTGLVGIEAISRGAKKVTFVERDFNAFKTMKKNLLTLNIEKVAETFKTDAENYLKKCDLTFDILYIDPPYKSDSYQKIFQIISNKKTLLSDDGKVIVEHSSKIPLPDLSLNIFKSYKYGDTSVTIYNKEV